MNLRGNIVNVAMKCYLCFILRFSELKDVIYVVENGIPLKSMLGGGSDTATAENNKTYIIF